jgi:hypothetical protein
MEQVRAFDLNQYLPYISMADIEKPVTIKLLVNGNTGEVRAYDPTDRALSRYWYFYLNGDDLPLTGNWVALRTNGASLSFGMN